MLAIDIGGTKFAAGLMTPRGVLLDRSRAEVERDHRVDHAGEQDQRPTDADHPPGRGDALLAADDRADRSRWRKSDFGSNGGSWPLAESSAWIIGSRRG